MMKNETGSRYVQRGNVRLHYFVVGVGPTLILIHGFPDFWNGWRHQIAHFRTNYRVVAVDLRGVNLSDKPPGTAAYHINELVRDTLAVMPDVGVERASIISHDWCAMIGWWLAIVAPERVERLAALSTPHPAWFLAAPEHRELHYPS